MKFIVLTWLSFSTTLALAETGLTIKSILDEGASKIEAPQKTIATSAKPNLLIEEKKSAAPESSVNALNIESNKTGSSAMISGMEIESDATNTSITAKLSKEVNWANLDVEDHGTFLQVKFPATVVAKSGEFIDGKGPYVAKLAFFQVAADEAAVRIFLKRDANLIKTATKVDVLGSRVVIYIDHGLLEKIGIAEHLNVAKASPQEAPLEASLPAIKKSEGFRKLTGIPAATKQKHDVLNEKLEVVAMFSGSLLMGLMAILGLKRFIKRRSKKGDFDESPSIKTIANYPLSAKQKLTLIQIGDEKILLAVNSNSVSFLTNLARTPYANQTSLPLAQGLSREIFAAAGRTNEPAVELSSEKILPSVARSSVKAQFGNKLLSEKEPAAHLKLKDQPARGKPSQEFQKAPPAKPTSRIQVAIDDSGITDLTSGRPATKRAAASASPAKQQNQSIEDVTALIRRKLRDLPAKN